MTQNERKTHKVRVFERDGCENDGTPTGLCVWSQGWLCPELEFSYDYMPSDAKNGVLTLFGTNHGRGVWITLQAEDEEWDELERLYQEAGMEDVDLWHIRHIVSIRDEEEDE